MYIFIFNLLKIIQKKKKKKKKKKKICYTTCIKDTKSVIFIDQLFIIK